MAEHEQDCYEVDVPASVVVPRRYEGTAGQNEELRTCLRALTKGGGVNGKTISVPTILKEAGLNVEGGQTYDQSACHRFIDRKTGAPNITVGRLLYQRWVIGTTVRLNLTKVDNIFYHGVILAMAVREHAQAHMAAILCGHYFFYKRSALNPWFFVRGLLSIVFYHGVIRVYEEQGHDGSDGMPEIKESDDGHAFMKGNVIYIITKSRALKGSTFTVIPDYPLRSVGPNEEIALLFGYQIGGRESTRPTSSPFAATRISRGLARKARRKFVGLPDAHAKGEELPKLGFISEADVPKLLERHLKSSPF